MMNWIRSNWCKSMHTEAMWPMHGKYVCRRCLLEFPVTWDGPVAVDDQTGVLRQSAGPAAYGAQHRASA